MVSPVLFEHFYDGAFLVSEEEAHRSRDGGVIANTSGSDLPLDAGLVLTQAVAGAITATAKAGNTGNGTVGSTGVTLGTVPGNYLVVFTSSTAFRVFSPGGGELEDGATGAAYTDQIKFTITAGGTAFAAGDGFTIAVAAGNDQWAPYTATTPAQNLGILYNRCVVPANGSEKVTVITRQAQVNTAELVWDPSITAAYGISSAAGAGNTGNGTIGSLSVISAQEIGGVDPNVPTGIYILTAMDALTFMVEAPDGEDLGAAAVGTAFANKIGFTITAGGTAFVEGDSFEVTLTSSGQTQALAALAAAGIIAR